MYHWDWEFHVIHAVMTAAILCFFAAIFTACGCITNTSNDEEEERKQIAKTRKWIAVEGLIGAGKSTYLNIMLPLLRERYGNDAIAFVPEPVDEWIKHGSLEKATTDPYTAQTHFFYTRVNAFNKALSKYPKARIIISERSLETDCNIFWKVTCDNGIPTDLQKRTYPLLWKMWRKLIPQDRVDVHLNMRVSPAICQDRMKKRGRPEEEVVVSIDYQKQLLAAHESVYSTSATSTARICHIDLPEGYHQDKKAINTMAQDLYIIIDSLLAQD